MTEICFFLSLASVPHILACLQIGCTMVYGMHPNSPNNHIIRGTWWSTTVLDFEVAHFQPNILYIKFGAWHLTLLMWAQDCVSKKDKCTEIPSGPLLGRAAFTDIFSLSVNFHVFFPRFFWSVRLCRSKVYNKKRQYLKSLNHPPRLFGKLAGNMT